MRDSLDPLELRSLRTTGRRTLLGEKIFEAERLPFHGSCPKCRTEPVHLHGKDEKRIRDTPFGGLPAVIQIKRQRYKCPSCQHTFYPSLEPDVDLNHRATNRLVRYIQEQSLSRTFADLSREVGLDETTVRRISKRFIEQLNQETRVLPRSIVGVGTVSILGEPRALFAGMTGKGEWWHYQILSSAEDRLLVNQLRFLRANTGIDTVVTDLSKRRRQLIHREIPSAAVALDPRILIRLTTGGLEETRKRLRRRLGSLERKKLTGDKAILGKAETSLDAAERYKLDTWARDFPDLIAAYRIKEWSRSLATSETPWQAKAHLTTCLDAIPANLSNAFSSFVDVCQSWEEEILNWHRRSIAESLDEPLSRLGAAIRRMGRGYSFDVIRARLLYGRHPELVKPRRSRDPNDAMVMYGTGATSLYARRQVGRHAQAPAPPQLTTTCEELEEDFPE